MGGLYTPKVGSGSPARGGCTGQHTEDPKQIICLEPEAAESLRRLDG